MAMRRGRCQLIELRAELSDRHLAVLQSVAAVRLMNTRQIERLHFQDSGDRSPLSAARACRRALERLVQAGLLRRLERRVGGVRAGSGSFIYAISSTGQRMIKDDAARRRFREPSAIFVAHSLATSELYVRLHEVARQDADIKLQRIEAEPDCWRRLPGLGGRAFLKPDLFVNLTAGDYEYRWFLEVDLGTEHRPALMRKARAYEAYYRSGIEQAAAEVFPRVLWVAPDRERAAAVRRATDGANGLTPGLFAITTTARAVSVLSGGQP